MRRRVLQVDLDGYGSLVRGYGSRELLFDLTGRAPVWSNIRRGWSVQEKTARDVIAAADARGFDVLIAGSRKVRLPDPVPIAETIDEVIDTVAGLW